MTDEFNVTTGMRAEYRAEYQAPGGRWFPAPQCCNCRSGWGTKQQAERNAADWKADGFATRLIRRYVTTTGMAAMIARMHAEYAIEHQHTPGGQWHQVTGWSHEPPLNDGHTLTLDERVVRRYATEPEEA